MARKIPPFAAIRAFEAVARLGRNVDAAQELGITPSAVSHQIRSLEAFTGTALLRREAGQNIELTLEGQSLLNPVQQSLDILDDAFSRQSQHGENPCLKIHMFQSLANMWLIPNLGSLKQVAQNLRIVITTKPEAITLSGMDVDMAIVYADAQPQKNRCIKLFDEVIQPVCSPAFLQERGPLNAIEDIVSDPLILSHNHRDEWRNWFGASGIAQTSFNSTIELDNRSNTLQAAASGLGWAMDRRPFGQDMRNKGLLVAPLDAPVASGHSYYLVTSQRVEGTRIAILFRTWLQRICADFVHD